MAATATSPIHFSPQEEAVVDLLMQGCGTNEIAERTRLSPYAIISGSIFLIRSCPLSFRRTQPIFSIL
jgi:hypothetical protein